jgi:hypothetical protein
MLGGCATVKSHVPAAVLNPTLELCQIPGYPHPIQDDENVLGAGLGLRLDDEPGPVVSSSHPSPRLDSAPEMVKNAADQPVPTSEKGKAKELVEQPPLAIAGPSCTQPPLPTCAPPKSMSLPPPSGPWYATQMPALFTLQQAHEEEIQEAQQKEDRLRIEATKRAKNTVTVYAWRAVSLCQLLLACRSQFLLGSCLSHPP